MWWVVVVCRKHPGVATVWWPCGWKLAAHCSWFGGSGWRWELPAIVILLPGHFQLSYDRNAPLHEKRSSLLLLHWTATGSSRVLSQGLCDTGMFSHAHIWLRIGLLRSFSRLLTKFVSDIRDGNGGMFNWICCSATAGSSDLTSCSLPHLSWPLKCRGNFMAPIVWNYDDGIDLLCETLRVITLHPLPTLTRTLNLFITGEACHSQSELGSLILTNMMVMSH